MELRAAQWRGALPRLPPIGFLWPTTAVLVALYACHNVLGLGGHGLDGVFDDWINDGLLWCAAVTCGVRAVRSPRSRAAWSLVALALASWAVGDTIWSIRFGAATSSPATSISDVFWLAWYPLIVGGLILLVRDRVPGFELPRWIDGIIMMLLLATPWVALFLQPVAEHSNASELAVVLDVVYPLADAVLVGAVLGVFALMAWHPGRMWLALGLALSVMGIADAISSVQALAHSHSQGIYDASWAAAAILVAYAAWRPQPDRLERRESAGWQAIVLALAAQAVAISFQAYAIFNEVPRTERILTVTVLLLATMQIVLNRPRPRFDSTPPPDAPGSPAPIDPPGISESNNATQAEPVPRAGPATRG